MTSSRIPTGNPRIRTWGERKRAGTDSCDVQILVMEMDVVIKDYNAIIIKIHEVLLMLINDYYFFLIQDGNVYAPLKYSLAYIVDFTIYYSILKARINHCK